MVSPPVTVLHVISNLDDGGAEGALYRLCLHDKQHRHVVVSMMDGGKYGHMLQAAGITVHCLNMPQGKPTVGGLWRLWRLIRITRPGVTQTWMYHADLLGGVLARLAGVRRVCWGIRHSNLTPGTVKRSTIWVAKVCAKLSGWVPSCIVSCSRQAVAAHAAIGYNVAKFVTIPNGYDLSHYAPDVAAGAKLRREWGIPADFFLMGMVARFDAQKDHANLIAALGELKRLGHNFRCVLVGTGMEPDNTALQKWLKHEGVADRVSLLGRRDDIPAVMNALDVHVLSSLGEAFPNVLAEAMACGTPCVTTDVGDAAMIVGDHGWAVPSQNSSALAASLIQAKTLWASDAAQWQSRRSAAREHITRQFSVEQMCARYDSVWNA